MKRIIYNIVPHKIFRSQRKISIKARGITSRQVPYEIKVIAEKLFVPWAIAISDNGKLYFTERSGTIRVIEGDRLNPRPLITFTSPFVSKGEGGLLGIALGTNYLQNHYMYVMHSYEDGGGLYNRVVRLIENNNRAEIDRVLIDKIPGGAIHNGGRIKIGPDKKLYITTGDAGSSNLAQDMGSTGGKILRIELDGSIPKDNPFENSPIYSFGHRDPQGLAWNLQNVLYESEHGQIGHDEINIIKPGLNYGWPMVQGNEESAKVMTQKPLIHSGEQTWAPSGIAFVNGGPWAGKLLVAALRGQQLLSITFNEKGTSVEKVESWFENEYGRLREVVQGKDGAIYIATSNRDGRGAPNLADDRIIKLSLKL